MSKKTQKNYADAAEAIKGLLSAALKEHSITEPEVLHLEHPADMSHGDYSTNIALALAKQLKSKPREVADKIAASIAVAIGTDHDIVEKVEVAGPGFINFFVKRQYFIDTVAIASIDTLAASVAAYGANESQVGKKILVEYTDPNPFKVFHIGHLMSNAIGESISRLFEYAGAHVERANYQGDVGLHVAKALWGVLELEKELPDSNATLEDMVNFLGRAYTHGSNTYEEKPEAKEEIVHINKMVFDRSNPKLNRVYEWGRKVSLLHFEVIYRKLGTKFDHYFFESEVAPDGLAIVRDFLRQGVFAESEGAVVFKGEDHGLHTRVFINSQGLPTYETKEIGLNKNKFDRIRPDLSVVITASEQNDYFKVVLKALSLMFPYIAEKTRHVSHGMLRFASGKMSSRKGNVITGESLLADVEKITLEKMLERSMTEEERHDTAEAVAVGAVKYSILKQAPGSDIVYDFDKSISFEGDSGPYLQYSCVRAGSIIDKAEVAKIVADMPSKKAGVGTASTAGAAGRADADQNALASLITLEKLLARFPEVIARAQADIQPHHVTTYLIELSAAFNGWYATTQIINADDANSPYYVMVTTAFRRVMQNGLYVLGIRVPTKM